MAPKHPLPSTDARRGFTRLELAAVIAVLGVLLAILLPAVQATRESARRTQCLDQLARLGVALQTYESVHAVLPPGTIDSKGPIRNVAEGYHMGWIVQLLPQVGQEDAFGRIDFSHGVYAPPNAPVRAIHIPLLTCPSYAGPVRNGAPGQPGACTVSNYAGCCNGVEAPIDVDNDGLLFLNSHTATQDIADGAKYTFCLGEKLGNAEDLGWMSGTRATLRDTGWRLDRPQPAAAPKDDLVTGGFASDHPEVCNFLFGDGHTKSIHKQIDLDVLERFGNRSDSQSDEPNGTKSN